jgi:hypothetical protein
MFGARSWRLLVCSDRSRPEGVAGCVLGFALLFGPSKSSSPAAAIETGLHAGLNGRLAAEILSPRNLGMRVSSKASLPSGCHPERAIVESPVNNLALLSVLRAGRVRKAHLPWGQTQKSKMLEGHPGYPSIGDRSNLPGPKIGDRSLNFIILVHAFHSTNPLTPRWGALAGYDRSWDIWPFDLSPKIEVGDRSDKSKKSHLGTGRQSP